MLGLATAAALPNYNALPLTRRQCLSGRSLEPAADIPRWRIEHLIDQGVRDLSLYHTALTAPSALPAREQVERSYDRLEMLGDAVLSTAVRRWIYHK
jgi:dsRNA-specific ribonuclease